MKPSRKPETEKALAVTHIRCKSSDKSRWVHAAKPGKLSAWIVDILNREAKNDQK